MKLNLGCSDRHLNGYVNVDLCPPADQFADLSQPWPWETSSVECVQADDIIEHIADKIHFMNELHRVMKNSALAYIITPNAARGAGFWQDPTHKSGWVLNSFQYFQHGSFALGRLGKAYGITASFNIEEIGETPYQDAYEEVWKIRVVLEAVK